MMVERDEVFNTRAKLRTTPSSSVGTAEKRASAEPCLLQVLSKEAPRLGQRLEQFSGGSMLAGSSI